MPELRNTQVMASILFTLGLALVAECFVSIEQTYLISCALILLVSSRIKNITNWREMLPPVVGIFGVFTTGRFMGLTYEVMTELCLGSACLMISLAMSRMQASKSGFKTERHFVLVSLFYNAGMIIAVVPLGMFP